MQERIFFGVTSMPLSEAVDMFMSLQNNSNQNHKLLYRTSGRMIWKELLGDTLTSVRSVYVAVDQSTKRFTLPKDIMRLYSISFVDKCGIIHPIFYDENVSTLELLDFNNEDSCGCQKCKGKDSLCSIFETVTYTDTVAEVSIEGTTDTFRIRKYVIRDVLGKVTEVTEYYGPYDVNGSPTNDEIFKTTKEVICNLELDDNGCVCNSHVNNQIVETHLRCYMSCRKHHEKIDPEIPATHNRFGYYTEIEGEDKVMKITSSKEDVLSVLVSYQSTGDNLDFSEYIIPEYALRAFYDGIYELSNRYVPGTTDRQKLVNQREYKKATNKLRGKLRPIKLEEFMAIGRGPAKW